MLEDSLIARTFDIFYVYAELGREIRILIYDMGN